jgi:hypothetical protein
MGASGAESLAKGKRAGTLIGRIGDAPPALSRSESDRRLSAIPSDGRGSAITGSCRGAVGDARADVQPPRLTPQAAAKTSTTLPGAAASLQPRTVRLCDGGRMRVEPALVRRPTGSSFSGWSHLHCADRATTRTKNLISARSSYWHSARPLRRWPIAAKGAQWSLPAGSSQVSGAPGQAPVFRHADRKAVRALVADFRRSATRCYAVFRPRALGPHLRVPVGAAHRPVRHAPTSTVVRALETAATNLAGRANRRAATAHEAGHQQQRAGSHRRPPEAGIKENQCVVTYATIPLKARSKNRVAARTLRRVKRHCSYPSYKAI